MGTIYKRGDTYWVKLYQHGKPRVTWWPQPRSSTPLSPRQLQKQLHRRLDKPADVR